MKDLIMKSIKEISTEILDFTKSLIGIPTENPPGMNYKECIHLIERKLHNFDLETEMIEIEIPKDLLYPRYAILSFFGEGKNTVYFHGHYDVVPAEDESRFSPLMQENKLLCCSTS